MLKQDMLLAFINEQAKVATENIELTPLEQLEIQTTIAYIFNENHDLEYIYYSILDFFEEISALKPLVPTIENYYSNL